MDFHLTYGLRLHTMPKHQNLYDWAINEIDSKGQQIGCDQIPWPWSLNFTATSYVLSDKIEIKSKDAPTQGQIISVTLRPGFPRDDADFLSRTNFSMFGTDRSVQSFHLEIHPISDQTEQERCATWGSVSYTSEVDFRNETTDDCIFFYLFVKPDTFARYAAKIAHGLVDEIFLRVGSVAGFYSEWSPSIRTTSVKILTTGEEQSVILPPGLHFEPPRLGEVGSAILHINRRLEFSKPALSEESERLTEIGTLRVVPETRATVPVAEPATLQSLTSLKRAAWLVVVLLALLLVVTLLQR